MGPCGCPRLCSCSVFQVSGAGVWGLRTTGAEQEAEGAGGQLPGPGNEKWFCGFIRQPCHGAYAQAGISPELMKGTEKWGWLFKKTPLG